MNTTVYLVVMVGVIALISAILLPALFWKKCAECGSRSIVDATSCKRCGCEFPEEGPGDE